MTIEPTPTTLTLPCGMKSTDIENGGRMDPEQFGSHVMRCMPCARALSPREKSRTESFLAPSPGKIAEILS